MTISPRPDRREKVKEQDQDLGGVSPTEGDAVDRSSADTAASHDEDHVCGGCGKLDDECDCDYQHGIYQQECEPDE
jgi:hypothetical protein